MNDAPATVSTTLALLLAGTGPALRDALAAGARQQLPDGQLLRAEALLLALAPRMRSLGLSTLHACHDGAEADGFERTGVGLSPVKRSAGRPHGRAVALPGTAPRPPASAERGDTP